jgi:hypothetical protein
MATPNLGFDNFFSTTLSGAINATDTIIPLNAVPTADEGYLVISSSSATKREIIYYTSKGGSSVTCPSAAAGRGVGGTTAQSHDSGEAVEANPVGEHFKALQDGTAISTNAITAPALATSAILLGYKNIAAKNGMGTGGSVLDFTDATTSLTVTVPAGGRSLKISGYVNCRKQANIGYIEINIRDGALNTDTSLAMFRQTQETATGYTSAALWVIVPAPAAGSRTFSISASATATSVNVEGGQFMVELV